MELCTHPIFQSRLQPRATVTICYTGLIKTVFCWADITAYFPTGNLTHTVQLCSAT